MRIAFAILGGLLMMSTSASVAKAQFDPFDSYGAISWEDEKAHLDNFAIALQHDPSIWPGDKRDIYHEAAMKDPNHISWSYYWNYGLTKKCF